MPYPVAAARGRTYIPPIADTPWYRAGSAPAPVAAWQAKGAASLSASYSNLANPGTHDLTVGYTAPSFATGTGWTFDGYAYLVSDIVPTKDYTTIVRYSNATNLAGNRALFGTRVAQLYDILSEANVWYFQNGGDRAHAANSSGVVAIAGGTAYEDGSSVGSIPTSESAIAGEMYVGAANDNGGGAFRFNASIQAIAVYSSELSGTIIAALTTAMNAL